MKFFFINLGLLLLLLSFWLLQSIIIDSHISLVEFLYMVSGISALCHILKQTLRQFCIYVDGDAI